MPERISKENPKKQQRGRPRRPERMARRNRVVTLVTDSELELLQAAADVEGQSISAFVRQILSQFLKRKEDSTKTR